MSKDRKLGNPGRNMSSQVSFSLEGDWVKAAQLINNLSTTIRTAALKGEKEAAFIYYEKLRNNVKTNGKLLGYPQEKVSYEKKKQSAGLSGGLFRLTDSFLTYITIIRKPTGYWVGVKPGKKKDLKVSGFSDDLTISEYVNVLEHGSPKMGIRKRPIFRDTFRQMGGLAGVKAIIMRNLSSKFTRMGIKIS